MTTHPKIIFIITISMAVFVAMGMVGTFLLIEWKAKGEMVAIMAGFTGTALGQLGGMLNNTRTQGPETMQAQITNSPANPVNVTETK